MIDKYTVKCWLSKIQSGPWPCTLYTHEGEYRLFCNSACPGWSELAEWDSPTTIDDLCAVLENVGIAIQ
jgi:hypothetical protein